MAFMSSNATFVRVGFVVALVSTLGSLYFSEILGFPPCVLCWYQRIAMYPLVLIFGAALWYNDSKVAIYCIPLTTMGLVIAGYHNLLYYGLISDSITPCKQGVSCTSKQVELMGFLTIPLMSLIGFFILILIGICLVRGRTNNE